MANMKIDRPEMDEAAQVAGDLEFIQAVVTRAVELEGQVTPRLVRALLGVEKIVMAALRDALARARAEASEEESKGDGEGGGAGAGRSN
jgi:hypothetical protein